MMNPGTVSTIIAPFTLIWADKTGFAYGPNFLLFHPLSVANTKTTWFCELTSNLQPKIQLHQGQFFNIFSLKWNNCPCCRQLSIMGHYYYSFVFGIFFKDCFLNLISLLSKNFFFQIFNLWRNEKNWQLLSLYSSQYSAPTSNAESVSLFYVFSYNR